MSTKRFISVFLISLRLPLCLIKLFISSLDNTLNPSNVTVVLPVRSTSALNEDTEFLRLR